MNRTSKYLAPALKGLGHNTWQAIRSLNHKKFFISHSHRESLYGPIAGLYILTVNPSNDMLKYMRSLKGYVTDYPVGDIRRDTEHVLIFSPARIHIRWFMHSKYSRMYTSEELIRYFVQGSPAYMVLSQHRVYKKIFEKDMGLTLPDKAELDSKWDPDQETLKRGLVIVPPSSNTNESHNITNNSLN